MIRLFSALGLLFLTISVGLAQSVFHLDSLPSQGVLLDKGWKFHAGDNPDWAKPELDDAKWEAIDPTKDIMAIPQLWKAEVGWFRLRFTIDSTLAKKSIAILLQQTGASEIFLNNELIGQFGTISHNSHQVKAATPVNGSFIGVPISKPGEQVLAVRFAMQKGVPYVIFADRSNTTLALRLMETKTISLYLQGNITVYFDFLRVGLYLIFFVIHLALFWFNPSQKPNLYFSLYAFLNSLISILIGLVYDQVHMATTKMLLLSIVVLIFLVGQLFFLTAVYKIFNHRRGILYWVLVVYALASLVLLFVNYYHGFTIGLTVFSILSFLESIRITALAIRKHQRGAAIVAWGAVSFLIFYALFYLFAFGYLPAGPNWIFGHLAFNISDLSMPIAISVYLALESSFTSRSLKEKLQEVETLSAEKQHILSSQNETLEKQVTERTTELADKNRELVIEAALEKIRSCSLGMHRSGEIKEVVAILFEKLKELHLVFDGGAAIHLFTEGSKNAVIWVASPDLAEPSCIQLPYDEHAFENNPIILDVWEAKETGKSIYNKLYSFNEKNRYFDYVFKYNDFLIIPQSIREFIYQTDSYTASFIAEKNSLLGANSWTRQLFSGNDLDVLKRITRVFEQAYIRFLDLQKAEAQAREAKIEAALERVRARSMAMQHSDELQEAATLLFQQVQALGIPSWSCGYNIWQKEEKVCTGWMSSEGFRQPPFQIPLTESPTFIHFYESRQKGESFYVEEVEGEALVAHYEYMRKLPVFGQILDDFLQAGFTLPSAQIHHVVNFSHGNLIFITHEPVPEAWDIFKRFAQVFDQTYTRFLDLQKAEIQALTLREEKQRLEKTLTELRMTQVQLIQKEKMASLGELTAGIAHEIQNPLNFVNNFSEVSTELVTELEDEHQKSTHDTELEAELLGDLKQNLQKITHHGRRASAIVKGMLEHSRTSTGERQPTDLNALADEYLRLAYQGLRAKDKTASADRFNCELVTDFDPRLGKAEVAPQEVGRVLLNLYNNAFYAVSEKQKTAPVDYQPTVTISTQRSESGVEIHVKDNGTGMPEAIKAKIFQPFFTTKPTGEGTGLGLSLSYDIVTKGHSGTIEVKSTEGEGTEFIIQLPR